MAGGSETIDTGGESREGRGGTGPAAPEVGAVGTQPAGPHQLRDLVPYRFRPELRALIADAIGVSRPADLQREVDSYLTIPERHLLGYTHGQVPLALLGVELAPARSGIIVHLAVAPTWRRCGLGRGLLHAIRDKYDLHELRAATDASTLPFYRRVGFDVRPLEAMPVEGERFECIWRRQPVLGPEV